MYGYYVLAFLLDDELVARVDLKADRTRGVLMAKAAFAELGLPVEPIVEPLASELTLMASWLGLDAGVEVGERGDLSRPLSAVIGPIDAGPPEPISEGASTAGG